MFRVVFMAFWALLIISACGVKGRPVPPKPSVKEAKSKELENKKKSNNKKSTSKKDKSADASL